MIFNQQTGFSITRVHKTIVAMLLAIWGSTATAYAQIVADGTTTTTVSTGSGGAVTVTVAPPDASETSWNRYEKFNVGAAGVFLDNTGTVSARTVVNEVTSTSLSYISGNLEVLGPDAHVIIANPNGIVVNGGKFINTGGVALVAGSMSERTVITGPGIGDINPVATTSAGGTVVITGDGLTGNMTQLLLAADRVTVDGAVSFDDNLVNQNVTIYGGSNEVEFESARAATNNILPWYTVTNTAGDTSGVVIDITSNANISSGTISLLVNDAGAGVRTAGNMTADAGEMLIQTNGGTAYLEGGEIAASTTVKVEAGAIAGSASASNPGVVQAISGDVQFTSTSGDISLTNYQIKGTIDRNSQAGVTFVSARDITLATTDKSITTLVTAVTGGIHLQAVGNITNNTSQIFAPTGDINIQAGNSFNNIVQRTGTGRSRGNTLECIFFLCFGRKFVNIDFSNELVPGGVAHITASSGNVIINADSGRNYGGSIVSNNGGDITITTPNGFVNEAAGSGQFSVERACFLVFCNGFAFSDLIYTAGEIAANGKLVIDGGVSIDNLGGAIFGNNGVELKALNISNVGLDHFTAVERPGGLKSLFGYFGQTGKAGFSFTQKVGGTIGTDGGTDITFVTSNIVKNHYGELRPSGSSIAPNGIETLTYPTQFGPLHPEPTGLFFESIANYDENEASLITLGWPWFFF